jgi:hypothetical protein
VVLGQHGGHIAFKEHFDEARLYHGRGGLNALLGWVQWLLGWAHWVGSCW